MKNSIGSINTALNQNEVDNTQNNFYTLKEMIAGLDTSVKQLQENKKEFAFCERELTQTVFEGLQ